MIKVNTATTVIKLLADEEELPARRYSKFQKYLMIDAGLGSDLESIGTHYSKLFELIALKKNEEAMLEANNLYYNFHLLLTEVNLPALAFCCCIEYIGEERITDFSEEALTELVNRISVLGVSQAEIKEVVESVKKKISHNLKRKFPEYFNDAEAITFFARIKQRINLITAEILEGTTDELQEKLQESDLFFSDAGRPLDFNPDSPDNAIQEADKNFENLCTIIEMNGTANAADLSTAQFYYRLEYYRKYQPPAKIA